MVTTNLMSICLGEWVACSVGANFTPHIITVNAGEVFLLKSLISRLLGLWYFLVERKLINDELQFNNFF